MSIAQYLTKFALGVSSEGVLSAAKGGTGTTTGGGGSSSSPTITAITYPGDDTAVNTAGGDTVTLTGTNFGIGVKVVVNGTQASVVSRISSTQLTFTTSAQATGSYIIYVVNTDGTTALAVPGLQYSPVPTWTTAAGTLGTTAKNVSFSTTVTSTGDVPISYSIASGTLPSGITLNSSTGVLSGTTPNVSNSTTYNFTVRATDAQLQDTDRSFSITILADIPTPTVEYLVVAGGGGGGSGYYGGGGGAGGYRTATGFAVDSGSAITVTVGAGGTGSTSGGVRGGNGSNSVFGSITSVGGGGGGSYNEGNFNSSVTAGANGGSGGGAGGMSSTTSNGGTATAGQGNNGGSVTGAGGASGGGAGAAGTGGSQTIASPGGIGLQSSISGSATYYAGGGGAGKNSGINSAGGLGGGGTGGWGTATAGTANTGGGGGGGGNYYTESTGTGRAGGSGIVIIRYADTYAPAASTTGSPTITVAGGYRVYSFTSSGSITF